MQITKKTKLFVAKKKLKDNSMLAGKFYAEFSGALVDVTKEVYDLYLVKDGRPVGQCSFWRGYITSVSVAPVPAIELP